MPPVQPDGERRNGEDGVQLPGIAAVPNRIAHVPSVYCDGTTTDTATVLDAATRVCCTDGDDAVASVYTCSNFTTAAVRLADATCMGHERVLRAGD